MSSITKRFDALSPKQRELLELQLKLKGLDALAINTPATQQSQAGIDAWKPQSQRATESTRNKRSETMDFSLFFFSHDGSTHTENKYSLLLESARFADANNFSAVWTPERHFQDFGGLYPNPSVLGAALAMITKNIQIRAGSVALPLHSPIRVAEEWSVVDNLSNGRVAIAFASGWHPFDFVLSPSAYTDRKDHMFRNIQIIKKLWRGETVTFQGVDGRDAEVRTLPRPVQHELPTWIAISKKPESWVRAGEIGANVLTTIVKQPLDVLAAKIRLYRAARAEHGHDPDAGRVTVMLHTFVGEDNHVVKEIVKEPMTGYFRSNIKQFEFQADLLAESHAGSTSFDPDNLTDADLDVVASYAFERYFETSLLCGTPDKCSHLIKRLMEIGVSEVACLIDFGVSVDLVMESLTHLNILRERFQSVTLPNEDIEP
jgi:natural product biosynthesis luciferase-like monooxygenase protein